MLRIYNLKKELAIYCDYKETVENKIRNNILDKNTRKIWEIELELANDQITLLKKYIDIVVK